MSLACDWRITDVYIVSVMYAHVCMYVYMYTISPPQIYYFMPHSNLPPLSLPQAGLQPQDSVEVLYEVGREGGGASLAHIIQHHKKYIWWTLEL